MKKLNEDEFFIRASLKHRYKYDYSLTKYKNRRSIITIICPIHGEFNQQAGSHVEGSGCAKCKKVFPLNTTIFIEKAKLVHSDKYDYSLVDYKKSNEKVNIICKEHGIFLQKANDHLSGRGCSICRESKGEKQIRNFLIKNSIKFIQQYKFNDCKNIYQLPFDFFLPDYNMCIEYQGRHHYEPVLAFGGLIEFEKVKKRDEIKEQYCYDNNIHFIKIKYNDVINDLLYSFSSSSVSLSSR